MKSVFGKSATVSSSAQANEALKAVHDTDYRLGPVFSMLYPASGIAVDWAYGEENIKYR